MARIVADYATDHGPDREAALIAEVDGDARAASSCVAGTTAGGLSCGLLLVTPTARGLGLGTRLVEDALLCARRRLPVRSRCGPTTCSCSARRIYQALRAHPHRRNHITATDTTSSARTATPRFMRQPNEPVANVTSGSRRHKRVCPARGPNQYSLEIPIQECSRSPATRSCKDPGTPSAAESDTWPCLVDARGSRTGGGREWQPCAVVRRVVPGFAWARGLDQVAMVGLEWVDWFNHRRLHSAVRDVPPAEYG